MSISLNYRVAFVVVPLFVSIASIFFAPLHFAGDQGPYTGVYAAIYNISLVDAYYTYGSFIGSKEPTHFLLIWVASQLGIDKNLLMALVNGLLAYVLMRLFNRLGVSFIVASLICFTNFYLIVLYFSSERLKFGVIIFIISLLLNKNIKKFYLISSLAIFSHIQLIIIYAALLIPRLSPITSINFLSIKYKKGRALYLKFFSISIFAFLIYQLIGDHIVSKYVYYSTQQSGKNGIVSFLQVFAIFSLTFLYTKKYLEVVLGYFPIIVSIFLLGADNVNIFAYTLFMSYALPYKKGLNFGVLFTSAYFFIKSFDFVIKTIQTGQGI